ncbi:MAG: HAD family phosphatase [Deltaproteobacteria bacterium]|nr:HAD family phosphatase [Deltaproteobacteria bacterium]MBW2420654.1 HAD family phosphatase [Deltaproteobacteria bacterium]
MSREIRAVLFDFGGVFTDSPFAALDELSKELGVAPRELLDIVFGPYDEDTDHPWHRLERGELSLGDARDAIIDLSTRAGNEVDPLELLMRVGTGGGARDPLVRRTRRLRAEGYRTALVTNNVMEFREHWRSVLPLEELFDVVVDSSEVGMRKPNPAIFLHALELLEGVAPEGAVFLDDYAGNIDAATRLGFHGVLVGSAAGEENVEQAILDLDEILGRA